MTSKRRRLDELLARQGLVESRSQGENYIKLGKVKVNGQTVNKPELMVDQTAKLELETEQYVSRAGLKLASVAKALGLDFRSKLVLDVGSSTGGFTDYALQHGAKKVIAVDVGTNQLHPNLSTNPKIELHEKTDIRNFHTKTPIDLILIDVSFISLRQILPAVAKLSSTDTQIVAMVKPQFEANQGSKHNGIVKNDKLRREILKAFEDWAKQGFILDEKADSDIHGSKGNRERFYRLRKVSHQ